MPAKTENIGLLVVHGMGEQKQLYHLRDTAREIASFVASAPGVTRFSVTDGTGTSDPRIVIDATLQGSSRAGGRRVRLHLHEVWWADLGIKGGIRDQLRFWLWGLGQWGAEAITEGTRSSNTTQLMVMPCFPNQRSREDRPVIRRRVGTHFALFGAAMLALLTAVTWSAAKRLIAFFTRRLPDPSLISLFLGDVMIYEQPVRPGRGSVEDPELPMRSTIRRRIVRGITGMVQRPYDRWFILAHSLGCVPAFNALQETELALPNYLTQAEWTALPAKFKTETPFVAKGAKPITHPMMPRRPPWLSQKAGIARAALFERFAGMVTYGCPLDKFAAIWPRIVCLNKQTAVFQPDCEWINLHDPMDPAAARLDAFTPPARDRAELPNDLKPLEPQNFACRALAVFLLAHIYYLYPRRSRTPAMAAAVSDSLLSGKDGALSAAAAKAAIGSVQAWLRVAGATVQMILLFAALLLAAGYLLLLIRNLGCDESVCSLVGEWTFDKLLDNALIVLIADVAIVLAAGLVRIVSDALRPRANQPKRTRPAER